MKQLTWLMQPLWALLSAMILTACTGTSGPVSVAGVRPVVGGELPGAQGLTAEDQDRIDDTMARGCSTEIWTRAECDRHTRASFERRQELRAEALMVSAEPVMEKWP